MYQNTPQRGPQKHTFLEGPLFKWFLKGRVCYYKNVNKIYHRNANNYVIICVVCIHGNVINEITSCTNHALFVMAERTEYNGEEDTNINCGACK